MNFFDIILLVVLIYAVWRGWSQGCVLQICSLVGLLVSLWVAAHFGAQAGQMLGVDPPATTVAGFLLVLVVCLVAIALAGHILKKILHFVGLGALDTLAGIAISVIKYGLILCVLFSSFASLNKHLELVEEATMSQSKCFTPMCHIAEHILPLFTEVTRELNSPK